MAKQYEIVDVNYVALTADVLIHLRTRERLSLTEAITRGIAREVDDPAEYYGRKGYEALGKAAAKPPDGMRGLVMGVLREDTVEMYIFGLPDELRSALVALITAVDKIDPPAAPPGERLH